MIEKCWFSEVAVKYSKECNNRLISILWKPIKSHFGLQSAFCQGIKMQNLSVVFVCKKNRGTKTEDLPNNQIFSDC